MSKSTAISVTLIEETGRMDVEMHDSHELDHLMQESLVENCQPAKTINLAGLSVGGLRRKSCKKPS